MMHSHKTRVRIQPKNAHSSHRHCANPYRGAVLRPEPRRLGFEDWLYSLHYL